MYTSRYSSYRLFLDQEIVRRYRFINKGERQTNESKGKLEVNQNALAKSSSEKLDVAYTDYVAPYAQVE
jgi:hypothetical protein